MIFPLILAAVEFSQAQANQRLKSADGDYSFAAPSGFEFKRSAEGFALFDAGKTIIIAVKSHDFQTFEAFAKQSNLEKDGLALVGKVESLSGKNKFFRASKQTAQGELIVDTFVLFSEFGGGALVVALSDAQNAVKGHQGALAITKNINFSKPPQNAANNQLQSLFRGKHLLYLYTSSGFSERTDIYLCPSGAFIYRLNSSSLSANGSGAVGGNSDGNWKISASGDNASLILQFDNGTRRDYKISRRAAVNEIGLNGNRYFVQNHNQCR